VQLTFLGTSAGAPTRARNVTAQLLAFDDGRLWLLDCGEATQHQLAKAGARASRIERILLTHLHGDHCLGLCGMLAAMAIGGREDPVAVVGPTGVAELVSTTVRLTHTELPFRLDVAELAPGSPHQLGQAGGWRIAAHPLVHRVACFGYCLCEEPRTGRFHPERAAALGVAPGPDYGRLQRGEAVATATGATVRPEQVLSQPRPGRVVVLLGDTEDASAIVEAGQGCDLLVCETTYDAARGDQARAWGHSSTHMTGELAARMQARTLVITHFSARYTDPAAAGVADALSIDELVRETAARCPGTRVLAAADLWSITIPPRPGDEQPPI
jgi:ribonuclease Z